MNEPVLPEARISRRHLLGSAAGSLLICTGWPVEAATKLRPSGLPDRESPLEARIDRYIKRMRRAGRIAANERTAWSVYDFYRGEKVVSINENRPMQSASMVKLFVVQAYFFRHQENPKRFPYDRTVRRKVEAMIRDSNNAATNEVMRLVSGRGRKSKPSDVNKVLTRHAQRIFKDTRIVEFIPRNGRSYRNLASARDYSRFLYATWHGHLPGSKEMKRVMRLRNHDRIAMGSKTIPRKVRVYDKTGTTARMCGNAGIVELSARHDNDAYTFIGIIDKSQRTKRYTSWLHARAEIILTVSEMVYAEIAAQRSQRSA